MIQTDNILPRKKKVLAYITNGSKLLVFEEPDYPKVGIQIPGGTVENVLDLEQEIIREIQEETGIEKIDSISYLGYAEKNMSEYGKQEIHERHFYWVTTTERRDQTWNHIEKFSSEGIKEILFKLYWIDLNKIKKTDLACEQGFYLDKLIEILKINFY